MTFSRQAKARSTLIRLGGLLLLLLLVNSLIGLTAIRYSNQAYLEDLDALDKIAQAQDLTESALIDFKKQVQEWKNILLRGDERDDLAKYRAAFERDYARVQETLRAMQAKAQRAGLVDLGLAKVIADHAALKREYDAALEAFVADQGADPRATDARVRGIDRSLTDTLDAIGESVAAQSIALRAQIQRSAAERYRNIVLYTIIANVVIAALVILILVTSLASRRGD
jgi:hypothetical protein